MLTAGSHRAGGPAALFPVSTTWAFLIHRFSDQREADQYASSGKLEYPGGPAAHGLSTTYSRIQRSKSTTSKQSVRITCTTDFVVGPSAVQQSQVQWLFRLLQALGRSDKREQVLALPQLDA